MNNITIMACIIFLASCAPAPMKEDQSQYRQSVQKQQIGIDSRCCIEFQEMNTVWLGASLIDQEFGHNSTIVYLNGRPTTAALYGIPSEYRGEKIEFISYSEKKRSVFRFDSVMFIAPAFVFLDENYRPVEPEHNPPVCWGSKKGKGGLWSHIAIPGNASYVVVAARNDRNTFTIDTRQRGSTSPVIDTISEARQSYVAQVGTGYVGLYSLELKTPSSPPLGRCFLSSH